MRRWAWAVVLLAGAVMVNVWAERPGQELVKDANLSAPLRRGLNQIQGNTIRDREPAAGRRQSEQ